VANSGDLIDRLIISTLRVIEDQKRRTEGELDNEFAEALPGILGALLEAISSALRTFDTIKLKGLPRMADFAKWVVAAEHACPWKPGGFIHAYTQNREGANQTTLEASAIHEPLIAVGTFDGTASELLGRLNAKLPEGKPVPKGWPVSPRVLSGVLRRIAPALRCVGTEIIFNRKDNRDRTRTITILEAARIPADRTHTDGADAEKPTLSGRRENHADVRTAPHPSGGREVADQERF
jgi:hypothetical protein